MFDSKLDDLEVVHEDAHLLALVKPGETIMGLAIGNVPPRVLVRVWSQYGTTGPYRIYIGAT